MSKTMHMSVTVEYLLRQSDRNLGELLPAFSRDDGTPYKSPDDLRAALREELAKGVVVLPLAQCDNFDPKEGCRGHV